MSSTNPVVLAMRRIYCCTGAGFASWELEAGWKEIERLEAKLEQRETALHEIYSKACQAIGSDDDLYLYSFARDARDIALETKSDVSN